MKFSKILLGLMLILSGGSMALADGLPLGGRSGNLDDLDDCAADFEVSAFPYTHSANLIGAANDCGVRASEDHIYHLAIPAGGDYTISLCESPAGTNSYLILSDACCGGNEITRNDDGCGTPGGAATLNCVSLEGGDYYLVVEAATPEEAGPYTLTITQCVNPCDVAFLTDGIYSTLEGSYLFVQTVDSSTGSPMYDGPFFNYSSCQSGDPHYGLGHLSWYDNDFGWTHIWPAWVDNRQPCVEAAELRICAWDVDATDCLLQNPDHPELCERDRVYADDYELEPQYLTGSGSSWSVTTFAIPPALVADNGQLGIWVDFDEYRQSCAFAGLVARSQLAITYRLEPCNAPPYTPEGYSTVCAMDDSALAVTVTGPIPADPDNDPVTYLYAWFVANAETNWEFIPAPAYTGPVVPASATHIGDAWRVDVSAVDLYEAVSPEPWTEYFTIVPFCGTPSDIVGFDYGDLDTTCYHLTGTELTGGPANPVRQENFAWLGSEITYEGSPNLVDVDGGDDGVTFVNGPWMPCTQVCVDVVVTAGAGYVDGTPLYVYAWKDGNLDCDFNDILCDGTAPECVISGEPVIGLVAGRAQTVRYCFTDPGVFELGVYDGVLRFRLLSELLSPTAALTSVDPLLGETEDYHLTDLQLAVELQSFTATPADEAIELAWVTASENHNDHFVIERRSADEWTRIADRIPGAGSSVTAHEYAYRDEAVESGVAYEYRLIAVDVLGHAEVLGTRRAAAGASPAVIEEYKLYTNYPNPFNPSTTIAFDLLEAGPVTLQVFDVTGRLVATLVDKPLSAGRHEVGFRAQDLPSGLYLYRLTAGRFSAMQKMILLK